MGNILLIILINGLHRFLVVGTWLLRCYAAYGYGDLIFDVLHKFSKMFIDIGAYECE